MRHFLLLKCEGMIYPLPRGNIIPSTLRMLFHPFNKSIKYIEYIGHRNEKSAGENTYYCICITQKIHESKENGFFVHKFSVSDILPIPFFLRKLRSIKGPKNQEFAFYLVFY